MATSLTEKLLAAKQQAKETPDTKAESTATETAGDMKGKEVQSPTKVDLPAADAEAKEIAKQAGATETPTFASNAGSPLLGGISSGLGTSTNLAASDASIVPPIVKQGDNPTDVETMTRRTEVSTKVDILPSVPDGSYTNKDGIPADPPLGVLPNSNLVYEGDENSLMRQAGQSLEAGKALNQVSEEDNRIAREAFEGEQRRQRMLEGRPFDGDQAAFDKENNEPAPEGGYKVISLTQFIDSKGNVVKPVNGYYVPENEEQEGMLKYYADKHLVRHPGDSED